MGTIVSLAIRLGEVTQTCSGRHSLVIAACVLLYALARDPEPPLGAPTIRSPVPYQYIASYHSPSYGNERSRM